MKHTIWMRIGAAASLALCIAAGAARAQIVMEPITWIQPASAAFDPQTKDELFDGLDRLGTNAKERNEVNLDKSMLALAIGKKGGRYGDLAQKMDFITVRNYEFAQNGQYQKSDLDALRHRLDGNGWSHIVRSQSDGESNDIVVKVDHEGFISDMVILNAEPKELNIVHLHGRFRMDDVQGAMGAGMGTLGANMGNTMGHVAAAKHPTPPAPDSPELKKR